MNDKDDNLKKLRGAFVEAFKLAPFDDTDVISFDYGCSCGGKEWDSLRHMALCMVIEETFDVMIPIELVSQIRSYWNAITVLNSLGVKFA